VRSNEETPRHVAGSPGQPDPLGVALRLSLAADPPDLAGAALVIARLEYPHLDCGRSLRALDELGAWAAERLKDIDPGDLRARVKRLNRFFYGECGFTGNRDRYSDVRNSMLNIVIERRLGIPITLALVYMEVAKRAGVAVRGIAFPGHFLLRASSCRSRRERAEADLILDPFNGGAALSEADCRTLLSSQMGDEVSFSPVMLQPSAPARVVARLLNNLKRIYIDLRAFAYARRVTDLLLALDPTQLYEIRDRGLLSYHLDDFPAALRDLEDYLRLHAWTDAGPRSERERLEPHVAALRRRVVSLN
jgi:regulator of sirC expression with transglutaminase-like and TPR domain